MKKYLNFAFAYAILAMAGGVFYREFTKWNAFTGATALGKVHTHLFILGMFLFLIVALFAGRGDGLERYKSFRAFLYLYNVGLPLTAVMMVARGIPQVLALPLSKGMDAAISGIAGIGHILLGTGVVLLLLARKNAARHAETAAQGRR